SDPIVAAERQLQTPAHGIAAESRHDRQGAHLQLLDEAPEHRRGEHRRGAELADVGATGKAAGIADDDHRLHGGIALGRLEPLRDLLPQCVAETVDRRVVEGDDGDRTVHLVSEGTHAMAPLPPGSPADVLQTPGRTVWY